MGISPRSISTVGKAPAAAWAVRARCQYQPTPVTNAATTRVMSPMRRRSPRRRVPRGGMGSVAVAEGSDMSGELLASGGRGPRAGPPWWVDQVIITRRGRPCTNRWAHGALILSQRQEDRDGAGE